MPALARGQENQPGIINWFITVNGILTDAFDVGFQIWDLTAGLPGTQIFPVTPGDWESVGAGAGHFSVGSYYAFNNTEVKGYTPGVAEPVGTHRIKWRWKITAGAPYQSDAEDFEVLVESAGGSADTYIQVSDVRAVGLTVEMASDATVLSYIETWQAFLERACRQWFNPRSLILEVDGNDSDTLFLGVPVISVDYIQVNESGENLDPGLFRVYNSRTYPDDRHNPRIALKRSIEYSSIFTAPLTLGELKFRKGRKNQVVKGVFGYTEADGTTPKLIKRALLKLVIEKLGTPVFSNPAVPSTIPAPPPILGSLTSETTDGHSIEYDSALDTTTRKFGLSGMTGDPEVLDIVKLYRAPLGLATPAHWSFN